VKLWNQLKSWASFSEDEKEVLDRRAFMKGMMVTGAGLLVPGASLFDMGGRIATVCPRPDFELIGFSWVSNPLPPLVSELIVTDRRKLAATLTAPIRRRWDYSEMGKKVFSVEQVGNEIVSVDRVGATG